MTIEGQNRPKNGVGRPHGSNLTLRHSVPRGDVLEMAGGTGWWTQRLASTAQRLTVIDSSPETLDLNRNRVGRPDVDDVAADLFAWQPRRTYDNVFFSLWLSHVPRSRFKSLRSSTSPMS